MTHQFKPLLSAKIFTKLPEDTAKNMEILRKRLENGGSALVSIKWDGWRMFEYNGKLMNRSMKPPKNLFAQKTFAEMFRDMRERTGLVGIDGEAIGGTNPMARNAMQNTTSAFGTIDSQPEWTYQVFDSYQFPQKPFLERLYSVQNAVEKLKGDWPWLQFTTHGQFYELDSIMEYLETIEAQDGEGVMGRDPMGQYKMGRSSMKDGILWALKPYADGDCTILSIHEMMSNQNEATINELGHTARSSHQENMVPKGTFGYAICSDPEWEKTFRIGMGPGLNDALRLEIWANAEKYVGKKLKYKYQAVGCVDRPRQPKWMGMLEEGR
jgi:DNA ligase-1